MAVFWMTLGCLLIYNIYTLYVLGNPCTATSVANSKNYKTALSITGNYGDAATKVECETGYSGGGNVECQQDGTFTTVECKGTKINLKTFYTDRILTRRNQLGRC